MSDYIPAVPELTGRTNRYAPVPADRKAEIIEDAKARIMDGQTLAEIAKEHGVTKTALHTWLAGLGDDYIDLRQRWLDNMLATSAQVIEEADNALDLARGRELFRVAAWHAERRDPVRYGQLSNIPVGPGISIHLNMLRAPQHGDNAQTVTVEDAQVIDTTDNGAVRAA